jgi:hypothetical protein
MKMLQQALATALLVGALVAPAAAKTLTIPESDPLVTVEVPDKDWTVGKIAKGVEISTADDEVYLAIESTGAASTKQLIDDAVAYLKREGVTIDSSTQKEKQGKLNGFDIADVGWNGKDKDGDVVIHLTIMSITPERDIVFTYWASPLGDKHYDPELGKILQSIKKAAK